MESLQRQSRSDSGTHTNPLSQPFTLEHLVIDGASTDGTVEALQELERHVPANSESGYTLQWISEPDRGLYDALNKGLRMASGDVIGILHTDDVWETGVLKSVFDVFYAGDGRWKMEDGGGGDSSSTRNSHLLTPIYHPEGVYGDLLYVDAEDITKVKRFWKSGAYHPKKWWNGWMPPHPALFVTRELAERVGEYRLDLGSAADYEWMLRACLVHQADLNYLEKVFVRMRVGGQSNVTTQARLKANAADRKAWELNGLTPYVWTLWMKPLRKLWQWVVKP